MNTFQNSSFERLPEELDQLDDENYCNGETYDGFMTKDNYEYNYSAARQTRTDDPLVNSQLSFEAQYRAANLLYHAELERRIITANPRTK